MSEHLGMWQKAWRKTSVRWGTVITLVIVLAGVYAPFLANDVALVWWDANGLSMPALSDLFNRWSYTKYYDIYFNVTALLLPPLPQVGPRTLVRQGCRPLQRGGRGHGGRRGRGGAARQDQRACQRHRRCQPRARSRCCAATAIV